MEAPFGVTPDSRNISKGSAVCARILVALFRNGSGTPVTYEKRNATVETLPPPRRFDAERVVEGFTSRINNITSTDLISSDLRSTLERTVAPASLVIWIRNS